MIRPDATGDISSAALAKVETGGTFSDGND
jgi:hypothetical protein